MKCINCEKDFTNYPEDLEFYNKMDVPEPEECPDCRQQRRVARRNFAHLYPTKCELTGQPLISRFNPKYGFHVINYKDWFSDKWNPIDYGRDYDSDKSFFDQFAELYKEILHPNVYINHSTNSDFGNLVVTSKGCFMVFGCIDNENCMYGHIVWDSRDVVEGLYLRKCELCYEVIDCNESYGLFWCGDCSGCNNCYYCNYCKGCQDCVGCYGLINQRRHILNQPCNDEKEYQEKKKAFLALSEGERKEKIDKLKEQSPVRESAMVNAVNCTGDYIYNSKNCKDCYDVKTSEDSRYCYTIEFAKDAYDYCYMGLPLELAYNGLASTGRVMVCSNLCLNNCNNIFYCMECNATKDCFGCVGLHSKEQFCILNKQYSEEEYNETKDQIIADMKKSGEWGKFFPIKDSPFSYNETMAQEYYPLTKEQALVKGYKWLDPDPKEYQPQACEVPKDIKEVKDDILKEVLACKTCQRNYKIAKQELDFYRTHELELPTDCFYCRHARRMAQRNPRQLFERKCDHCSKNIRTTYSPDRNEKVYCEECYQKEIY